MVQPEIEDESSMRQRGTPQRQELEAIALLIKKLLNDQVEPKLVNKILDMIRNIFTIRDLNPLLKREFVQAFVTCDAYLENSISDHSIQVSLSDLLYQIRRLVP